MTRDPRDGRLAAALVVAGAVAAAATAGGCGSTKMSGTARTGTEQLLLTNAWDSALQKVDFRPLTGVPIYLDTTHVAAVDQGWVVSSIRQAALAQGVLLRTKPEQAQWILEARVGAYGTDSYNWLFGVPQVTIPTTVTGMPAGTIPEIPIAKKTDQQAVAKLALFAYDRATGQITWTSGTQLATSNARDLYIGPIGPFQSGSIRPNGAEFIGVKLPLTSVPDAPSGPATEGVPFSNPALKTSPTISDRDAFAP